MSSRALIAMVLLTIGCSWTMRRPFVGVCMVIALFHLNLRVLGAGLEDIRFQFVVTIVLILSYFVNYEEVNREPAPLQPPMRWMFWFLAIVFATSAWAVASPALAFDSAIEFSKIVLFVWLMTKIVRTERQVRILLYVVFAGMWYTSFMAQWGVEWDWIDEVEVGIATGGTGAHLVLFTPLLILLALYGSWRERLAMMFVLPFVLNFLPNTPSGSRATLVMLASSLVFLILLAPGSMRIKALPPILAATAFFVFYLTPPAYWEDMATILHPQEESSARSRFIINEASYLIAFQNPLGIGYNNYSLVSMKYIPEENLTEFGTRDAHNSYLKVLTEFGFMGLGVWIGLFVSTWRHFRRIRKTIRSGETPTRLQIYALGLELGLLGIVAGIGTHNYNDLDTLYWFAGLSAILTTLHAREGSAPGDKEENTAPDRPVVSVHKNAMPEITVPGMSSRKPTVVS